MDTKTTSRKRTSTRVRDIMKSSVKRQVEFLCEEYLTKQRSSMTGETSITAGEAAAIRENCCKTTEGAREFNRWLGIYNTYSELVPLLSLAETNWKLALANAVATLRTLDALRQEENHLNIILRNISATGDAAAVEAFAKGLRRTFCHRGAIVFDSGRTTISLTCSSLWRELERDLEKLRDFYRMYKGFIVATDEFTRANRAEGLMPKFLSVSMEAVKRDIIAETAPTYSRKCILDAEARGERVTDEARRWAVLPSYGEIDGYEEYEEMFRERIKSIRR